jgi:PAS domain S-box-containing protein
MRILFLQANPSDIDLYRRALSRTAPHFTFEAVETLQDAHALLSARSAESPDFDLVVADLHLPDGNGMDLLTHIRVNGLPYPFVIITGSGDEEAAVAALKAGADDYIVKSNGYLSRLVGVLENALKRHNSRSSRHERPLRVLYAEDNGTDADFTRRHLARHAPHIHLDVANNTHEIKQRFVNYGDPWRGHTANRSAVPTHNNGYDAVLLGYGLPGLNALEMIKELRQEHGVDVPLILITGQGGEEVARQALKLGATDYLVRDPGYLHRLPGALENALYRSQVAHEQEALRRSEERFRLLAENSLDVIFHCTLQPEFRFDYISPAVRTVTGYTPEDFYADPDLGRRIIHPEDWTRIKHHFHGERILEPSMTIRWLRKDGAVIWTEQNITPYYDDAGKLVAFESIARDVTARMLAEQELKRHHRLLEDIVDRLPVTLFMKDARSGQFVLWNKLCEKVFGLDARDVIGKTDYDFFPKEQADFFRQKDQETFLRREPIEIPEESVDSPSLGPLVLRTVKTPVYDDNGEPMLLMASSENITGRKQAEEALRESERRFRDILETIDLGAVILDLKGDVAFCNDFLLELTGWKRQEILGENWFDRLIPEEARNPMKSKYLARISAADIPTHYENEILTRQGQRRLMAWDYTILWDPAGRVVGTAGFGRDITERRRLEAQLHQAQKMEAMGTLAGGIAHDFNNILSAILGYTEMALFDTKEKTVIRANLQEVLKATSRARDLVKQILAFSRQSEQEKRPIQSKLIIKEALKLLRASLPSTIEIKQVITTTGAIMADPTQIHQVLMNLATNAAHAMRERGGTLEVSLVEVDLDAGALAGRSEARPGRYVRLTVSDTGHGIDPMQLGRIFDPFFTTKRQGEGTGMGLAVVHGIVGSHRGFIDVSSEPGKGTEFRVHFPGIAPVTEPETAPSKSLPMGRERVLFVDDEPALALVGKQMLERLGYEVVGRTASLEALETFRRHLADAPFDLVITDMTMPHMTGVELTRELLELDGRVRIILCTGFSELVTAEKALDMGIRAFIMKPLVMQELAEAVRKVLDS